MAAPGGPDLKQEDLREVIQSIVEELQRRNEPQRRALFEATENRGREFRTLNEQVSALVQTTSRLGQSFDTHVEYDGVAATRLDATLRDVAQRLGHLVEKVGENSTRLAVMMNKHESLERQCNGHDREIDAIKNGLLWIVFRSVIWIVLGSSVVFGALKGLGYISEAP